MSAGESAIQKFVRAACPTQWAASADELAYAAIELFRAGAPGIALRADSELPFLRKSTHSRSSLLLAAFALENGIKGLLVAADPSHVNTGALSKPLTTHALPVLAKRVPDFSWSPDEVRLLELLSEALPYWGRYPIPREAGGLGDEIAFDEGSARLFWRLHRRLNGALYQRVKGGWDSGVGVRLTSVEVSRAPHEWDAPET
jgi:hypothetical protein